MQGRNTRQLLRKVPEVTIVFWIIKLLSTALGGSISDYLVNTFNPYHVVILGFLSFMGGCLAILIIILIGYLSLKRKTNATA